MPEVPQNVDAPITPKAESLKDLNGGEVLSVAKSLSERFWANRAGLAKTSNQDKAEYDYLNRLARVKNGRLNMPGHHQVDVSDPDHLWLAANVLYPKKEAEAAYYMIQSGQIVSMGGVIKLGWDATKIHQMLQEPKNSAVLAALNNRQIIYGENASLKVLEQVMEKAKAKEEAKYYSRRRFLKVAALGGVFLGSKMINDRLSAVGMTADTTAVCPTIGPTAEALTPPDNLFTEIIKPIIEEAMKRRDVYARANPEEYNRIIDKELNENRINLVVFGYGEEHGEAYEDYGGAPSILSLDLKTGKIGVIHFSRDIRVPELEQHQYSEQIEPVALRAVYRMKGFNGLRNSVGRMSGLVADYQVVMKDVALRDAVNKFAGGSLEIDVPKDHDTGPFRMDKVQYGDGFIVKGKQIMNTLQLMRYVLAEDKDPQGKEDERSYRKNQVTEVLVQRVRDEVRRKSLSDKIGFLGKVKDFIDSEVRSKNLELEFDPNLILKTVEGVIRGALKFAGNLGQNIEFTIPEIDKKKEVVFHDPYFGDGGVTRVHNLFNHSNEGRVDNPKVLEEVRQKFMPDWMLVPDGGNPYSEDLVRDYWSTIRKMVRACLLAS